MPPSVLRLGLLRPPFTQPLARGVLAAPGEQPRAESEQLLDALADAAASDTTGDETADDAADEKIRQRVRKDVENEIHQIEEKVEADLRATWWESLDQMLARVDILSINAPHTPSTFHLLNARRLKLMKPSAVIVNTSRGEVIDENALTRMLRAGELAGAGLDVFEHGHEINPRLRDCPNVVMLPHMGSATVEGRLEMGEKVLLNIKTFDDGHRPPDQVVPSML